MAVNGSGPAPSTPQSILAQDDDTFMQGGVAKLPGNEELPQRLTDWAKEPSLIKLTNDFQAAKPAHDVWATKLQHWNDLLHVRGTAKPKQVKGRSHVQPKLVRRQAEWRYSALSEPFLGSNRLFQVSPATWANVAAARQNDLVLNWQFRTKLNRVKLVDDYVRSCVDEGSAIVQVGWKRVTKMVKQPVPVYVHLALDPNSPDPQMQQSGQLFQQALQLSQTDPVKYLQTTDPATQAAVDYYNETAQQNGGQGQATIAIQRGTQLVDVEQVIENRPIVEVINPLNFFIDPSCNGDITKALFAIVSFETNKAELQKEPNRYKNLDKVNWETATPLTNPDHATLTPQSFHLQDTLRKRVVAYEYWGFADIDGSGELTPIVATWIGQTLIRMERNPFPDQKLPFVVVPYLPIKRELYGEPDAELLEDNQKILGAVTRGTIDLMGRSANSQQGFAKGMLDPLNRRRYENGQDYEFNPNINPAVGLIEHKYPEIPQSVMLMLNMQNQEAEALTGVKSFSGGISGEAYGQVAAGIRGVLDAAAKREMSILRRLANGMVEVGRKLIAMNAVFLSEKEVLRITDEQFVQLSPAQQQNVQRTPGGQGAVDELFLTVNREDLVGEFDLVVDISTAEVDNAQAQDLAFMLQTMGPNADPKISFNMIMAKIAELKRMPDLAHALRNYQPPPPTPQQQQMAALELQKAQLEIEVLQSQIALNNARAKHASSQGDLNDLDFVEQQSGVQHSREMDRIGAQGRSNQDLEVTKALTRPHKEGERPGDVGAAIGFNAVSAAKDAAHTAVQPVDSTLQRDALAQSDPRYSLGSEHWAPQLDPSANPNLNV